MKAFKLFFKGLKGYRTLPTSIQYEILESSKYASDHNIGNKKIRTSVFAISNNIPYMCKELNKMKIPLRLYIQERTKYKVKKASPELLQEVTSISNKAFSYVKNQHSFENNQRINECGNKMETILDIIDKNIIKIGKSAGYPDRELLNKCYIEVKLANKKNLNSTLRSFYMSTIDKVKKNLPHVLVCFVHEHKILKYVIVKDLYYLELNIKVELNSNNKEMYV